MKLRSLYIQNFRILEDFEVKKLGHLNLIVGKNNSGKSSVLEALRIYAGGANRSLLTSIANEHDEIPLDDNPFNNQNTALPFESFFTGRNFPVDEKKLIVISDAKYSDKSLWLEHNYYCIEKIEETNDKGETSTKVHTKIVQKSELHEFSDKEIFHAISVSQNKKNFLIELNGPRRRFFPFFMETEIMFPCGYIPTQFVSFDELADAWDKIALTEHEEHVKTALKFIEPYFESLAFIKNDSKPPSKFKRSAIVKIADLKPAPLNSMGDGMLRILQLALKVFSAKGGFLLIDEFENGLHYSVQEKVWAWLFALAERFNIQVFATTHSWDCVESFIKVALKEKNISGVLFRVGHSAKTNDNNKIIATEFEADELASITQADVEVR